ncbi:MAG: DUF2067 family protein [Desulfurococcaceae archaeon]
MPLVKRRLYVPCKGDECIKIYELLKDHMQSVMSVEMKITGKGILFEVYGYETDIKSLWVQVKSLIASIKELASKSGLYKYNVELLVKMSRKTFPPKLLVEVLKRNKHSAVFLSEENIIVTTASIEEVLELIHKIYELNSKAMKLAETTSTRYYLIACCIISAKTLEEVVSISLNTGVLEPGERGGYTLKLDWRAALDLALKSIKVPSDM